MRPPPSRLPVLGTIGPDGVVNATPVRRTPCVEVLADDLAGLMQERDALRTALDKAVGKLHACIVFSGTAPEFADDAVADFRAILAKKPEESSAESAMERARRLAPR